MKNFKKNQVVIFVIALMLVTAGYLNFTNLEKEKNNLLPTSSLADSEKMAAIGDATLVNANQTNANTVNQEVAQNKNEQNTQTSTNTTVGENNNNTLKENTNTTTNQTSTAAQTDTYFTQSKLDRDNMYSQMLENYQKILETEGITAEEKTNAQTEIKKINEEKNAIMIAENLIKTKGFQEVILFVNNGNVSAIIKAEKLDGNQVAQIQNIITRELNVKVTKINVSNKK